jgi:hypothetical protein
MDSPSSKYLKHLEAVMEWLVRAQRQNGGFSASYSYLRGWSLPYPETTGYIIETIFRYASFDSGRDWEKIVTRAGEWLLSLEIDGGGFPAGYGLEKAPRVFNTGMILFGLSCLYQNLGDERYKNAGQRTILWLQKIQNQDGSWTIASLGGDPHVYHSRVAWGILEMSDTLGMLDDLLQTIERANDWVVSQQNTDGWFENNGLISGLPPLTHNIAYAIRGLLECGHRLKRDRWLSSAIRAAQAVYSDWIQSGALAAGYWSRWRRGPSFRCVTGDAQFGVIWYRLWQITGEEHWLSAAKGIADQVAETQSLQHVLSGVRGGIPGSWPIWGRYLRFSYPNWAAKFFGDLLLYLMGK